MSVYIIAQLQFARREFYDHPACFFDVFRRFKGKPMPSC
jgi:hypothetical protein